MTKTRARSGRGVTDRRISPADGLEAQARRGAASARASRRAPRTGGCWICRRAGRALGVGGECLARAAGRCRRRRSAPRRRRSGRSSATGRCSRRPPPPRRADPERLPPVKPKPLAFPAPRRRAARLVDAEGARPSTPARAAPRPCPRRGRVRRGRTGPPNRAYLKLWKAFTRLGAWPQAGERCLDLGAAPGGWSWALARLGARVIAVDKAALDPAVAALANVERRGESAFALDPAAIGPVEWWVSDVVCYPKRLLALIGRWRASGLARNMVATIEFQGATDPASRARVRRHPRLAGSAPASQQARAARFTAGRTGVIDLDVSARRHRVRSCAQECAVDVRREAADELARHRRHAAAGGRQRGNLELQLGSNGRAVTPWVAYSDAVNGSTSERRCPRTPGRRRSRTAASRADRALHAVRREHVIHAKARWVDGPSAMNDSPLKSRGRSALRRAAGGRRAPPRRSAPAASSRRAPPHAGPVRWRSRGRTARSPPSRAPCSTPGRTAPGRASAAAQEATGEARQHAVGQRRHGCDAQHAGAARAQLLRGVGDAVEPDERALDLAVERKRLAGRHQAIALALEQHQARAHLAARAPGG